MSNPLLKYIESHKNDGVEYKARKLYEAAGDDQFLQAQAIDDVKLMLACIPNEIMLEGYVKRVAAIVGVKVNLLSKITKDELSSQKRKADEQHVGEGQKALPAWVSKDRLNDIGFDWRADEIHPGNTGMYFPTQGGHLQQLTNFVMKPVVQIISDDEDGKRRITEISNGRGKHVFELPSKAFISPDQFEILLMDQGYYHYMDGFAKPHLNKIKSYYLFQYPIGYELNKLGWQDEGFFAFSNLIYKNGIIPFDEYGLAEIDGYKYLSMGASNILANLRKGQDIYKNDKHLRYDVSPVSFHEWTRLMMAVYEEKAMMGVAWCLLAANRDIVSARTNYCPIPYCYGAAQSGKSKFVDSLCSFFTRGLKPFNLNQGTEFAFWEYMGRFKNVLMAYNEFDDRAVDEKRVRAFKGVADGEGRNKGAGKKNRTQTQEVDILPILLGQYLATMDDNSLLGRTIPEKFVENNNRSEQQIRDFDTLKSYEEKGISSLLCEVLEYRNLVSDKYLETYQLISRILKLEFARENLAPKNRVLENYITVLTMVKLYSDKLELAFTYEDFYKYCKGQIMKLNNMIGESNSLGEFWKLLEYMADNGLIESGWEYKIETHTEVKSMIGEKNSKNAISFEKPTRLLFLRMNNVYPLFAKEKRNQSGKPAIGEQTIKTYLCDQAYYVGAQSGGNFKSKKQNLSKVTSSMVINYDLLSAAGDVNLERYDEGDNREQVTLTGYVKADAELRVILNTERMVFDLWQDESYLKNSLRVKNDVYTRCMGNDFDLIGQLRLGAIVKVSGMLSKNTFKDKEFRTLEIATLEIVSTVPATNITDLKGGALDRQFIPAENRQMTFPDDLKPDERDEQF